MAGMGNSKIVEYVKEITVAAVSSPNNNFFKSVTNGKDVAEFMQTIYDKLNELDKKNQQ